MKTFPSYIDAVYCLYMPEPHGRRRKEFLLNSLDHFYSKIPLILFEGYNGRHLPMHAGCSLSYRNIFTDAIEKGFNQILILEEDAILHKKFDIHLERGLKELQEKEVWDMFYIGGYGGRYERSTLQIERGKNKKTNSCLTRPIGVTTTHGVLYSRSMFQYIVDSIPDDESVVADLISATPENAIDKWLCRRQNQKDEVFHKHTNRNIPIMYALDPYITTQQQHFKHQYFIEPREKIFAQRFSIPEREDFLTRKYLGLDY
jgi:GR25 family glycosyltransferase involved in LPS biosynthesis